MFRRKAKPHFNSKPSALTDLARKVGVERRLHVRVLYPEAYCSLLPEVAYNGGPLRVHDISVGGCCLLDPLELMGPNVGTDLVLHLKWADGPARVHCRLVARVDHKRHIQFMDLEAGRADRIRAGIISGTHGHSMKVISGDENDGPTLEASEVWSSLGGDTVIIESHVHRLARIHFQKKEYVMYREAWPIKNAATPVSRTEMDQLILFLCNIPQPSDLLKELIEHTCLMSGAGPR